MTCDFDDNGSVFYPPDRNIDREDDAPRYKRVIFPGSYDPITLGHLELIERGAAEYSEVYVVAFINPDKKYTFSESERTEMMRLCCAHLKNVTVDFSFGRVIDYMSERGIEKIIKGYRNISDLMYEMPQAEYNFKNGGVETEFYSASDGFSAVSSTLVREKIKKGEDLSGLLCADVINFLKEKKYI